VTAKVACILFKPEGVVAVTEEGLSRVAIAFYFRDIRGFGGELGDKVEAILGRNVFMGDLKRITHLINLFVILNNLLSRL